MITVFFASSSLSSPWKLFKCLFIFFFHFLCFSVSVTFSCYFLSWFSTHYTLHRLPHLMSFPPHWHDAQNEISTYGFETPRKSACRHLWRCCVEHHAFFRLVRVSPIQTHDGELFTLGSRFRYRYVNRNQFAKNSFAKNFRFCLKTCNNKWIKKEKRKTTKIDSSEYKKWENRVHVP